ncbi:MAG TPA: type I glutamate--ammonia ligase [Blastocatellia bacterium]|nr:type I glutamate--ammonia ligase [Blastocatellia bacterium]
MNPKNVLKFAADEKAEFVDVRFTDLIGAWHHLTFPIDELSEDSFEAGFGFDASSLRGWAAINESDMLMIPDPTRYWIDPFMQQKTLAIIADIADPVTKESYWLDPRALAKRAQNYLKFTGIADTVNFGPEAEFFIFDRVSFRNENNSCGLTIDSDEAHWNAGIENANGGYHIRAKEGYVPLPPLDSIHDIRSDIAMLLKEAGLHVECHHHEVATGGQCEIDFRFSTLLGTADNLQIFKYTVKNTAKRAGKTATFMPKPLYGDNGNGMHCHQSLWKGETPLFAGDRYAGISEMALHYIGGILKHAPALAAFAAPTTNSYKRLVPGFEAPVNLAYSQRNRSAAVRIPLYSQSPKAKRLEVRFPDGSCNAYLAFSAMLMAGLDGIQNKIDPGEPLDKDIYDLPPEELAEVPSLPGSLDKALEALEIDHSFLLKGEVFTEALIRRWIEYKIDKEINPVRMRPHPLEFALYYDV